MKIISLAGENLASLAAPFHIDFSQGVLADAGLFAICGNTGSGKSTLLDAICLSLFDAMPRFSNHRRGAAIGHAQMPEGDRLKSNDVRHILTRGASSCYSEVVFELDNTQRYQARWMLKRARNSASGRIQAQEMQLIECQSQRVLATKKTEVLTLIESLIGLNYEQFRRSVLLAQGDFAAFLKAPAKERSDLLERITGTQLYSTISKLAYTTAKESEQQLKLLQSKIEEVSLLPQEAQQALAKQLSAVNESIAGLDQQQQQLQWLEQTLEQYEAAVQQHSQRVIELEQVQQQCKQCDDISQLLQNIELAQGARVTQAQRHQNSQQQQVLLEQKQATNHGMLQNQQQVADTQEQVTQLVQVKGLAQQDFDNQLPRFEQAIARQRDLVYLDEKIANDRQQLSIIEAQQQSISRKFSGNEQQLKQNSHLCEQLAVFLSQNEATRNVVNQLPAIEQGIEDYLHHHIDHQQTIGQIKQANSQSAGLREQQQILEQAQFQDQAKLKQCQAQLQQYAQLFEQTSLQQLEQQQGEHQQQLTTLVCQQQAVTQGLEYQAMIGNKKQQQQDIELNLQKLRHQYQQINEQKKLHQPTLQEAILALDNARNVMSLHDHRQQLVDGQPCALCGGLEHPYSKQLEVGDLLVEQLNQRVLSLTEEGSELATQLTQLDAIGKEQAAQNEVIGQEVEQLSLLLRGLSHAPVSAFELANIESGIATIKLDIEQAKALHQQTSTQVIKARDIEQQLLSLQHQLELGAQTMVNNQNTLASLESEVLLAQQNVSQTMQQMNARIDRLSNAYASANWPELLVDSERLSAFKQQLAGDVEQYIEKNNYFDELVIEQRELDQTKVLLVEQLQQYKRQVEPVAQQLTRDVQQQAQWQEEISQITQGADPVAAKEALARKVEQLTQALYNAEQALVSYKNELLVSQNKSEQYEQRVMQLEAQAGGLHQDWQQWQAKLSVSEEFLNELLSYEAQWIIDKKQQQATLLQQLHQGQAIVAEQTRHIKQLGLKLAQQDLPLSELFPSLSPSPRITSAAQRSMVKESLISTLGQLNEQQFSYRNKLEQHNQSMLRFGQLQQEIDAQMTDTQLWLAMKDLIGSADGAKFRTFAQSLTLEQMLISANHHLLELAPRYRLQGVPGSELDLQIVDLDMGDEVRSVDSLSGGECFLVSLALALGLGSITSLQTSINTLFIDEGFGTLDPDTLEVALSCLDSLQATGRQIGIISHVQGLVERVGTRIQITAQGSGHSKIELLAR